MANCINTSSKEYIELLEQTKLNPLILKARISIFQDKNGLDNFPKVEDIIEPFIDYFEKQNLIEIFNLNNINNLKNLLFELNKINSPYPHLEVLKELEKILDFSKIKFKIKELKKAEAHYVEANKTITYDSKNLNDYYPLFFIETITHEVLHAITRNSEISTKPIIGIIQKSLNKQKINLKDYYSIKELYNLVLKNTNKTSNDYYGLTNVEEFISEAYSNEDFQSFLKSIVIEKENNKTSFEKFYEILLKILSLNFIKNNILEKNKNSFEILKDIDKKSIKSLIDLTPDYTKYHINKVNLYNSQNESTILFNKKENPLNEFVNTSGPLFFEPSKDVKNQNTRFESNKQLLFNNEDITKSFTSKEVLQNIIDSNLDFSKEGIELIIKAINVLNRANARVKIVSQDYFDSLVKTSEGEGTAVMAYNSDLNSIYLTESSLTNFTNEQIIETFLHEVAHNLSIKALVNPETFAEKEFNDLIEKAFEQYAYLGKKLKGSKSYGFTNKKEFVAELYSNAEFRQEIIDLDKGFWQKFKDAIRRLLGLPKSLKNDQLIDSILLIEKVEGFIENNNSEFEGFAKTDYSNSFNDVMFKKVDQSKEIELDTLDKHLQHTVDLAKDRIIQLIARTNSVKNPKNKEDHANFIKDFEKLLNELENASEVDKWQAINAYVTSFSKTVTKLKTSLDKLLYDKETDTFTRDIDKDSMLESINRYDEYLSAYDLLDEIKSLIKRSQNDITITKTNKEALNKIKSILNSLQDSHDDITSHFLNVKRAYFVKEFSKPENNTKVVSQWRDKLFTEHSKLNIKSETKEEYFGRMIQTKYKDEYENDLLSNARKIVYDPYFDISSLERSTTDLLNINSPLINLISNVIGKIRDSIISQYHDKQFEMKKYFDKYSKEKGQNSQSKMYGNLLELSKSQDKYYLKGEYSVEFLDSYNKMLDSIKDNYDSKFKKIEVQDSNFTSVNKGKKTISLRNTGEHDIVTGDSLMVTVKGIKTGTIVKVNEIVTFSNFKNLSEDRKNDFARAIGKYKNYEDFLNSNDYVSENSEMSQKYPEVYNFINGNTSMDIISYEKIQEDEKQYEKYKKKNEIYKKWISENTVRLNDSKKRIPHSKYKNKELTGVEKETLDYFKSETDKNNEESYNNQVSLIRSLYGAKFYSLPAVTKTDLERTLEGDIKGQITDKWKDLTETRIDDVTYGEAVDNKNKERRTVKIGYRGNLSSKDQSLDLFTVYKKEALNAINYKEKKSKENKLKLFVDIAKEKDYKKRSLNTGKWLQNKYAKNTPGVTFKGEFSEELKKIEGLLETHLYDVLSYSGGKVLGTNIEANKLSSLANGTAASIAMTANLGSGVVNILNGTTQLIIDATGGNLFNKTDLLKAEANYNNPKNIMNILADLNQPVKTSFHNQLLDMFDVMGGFDNSTQEFIRNTLAKKLISRNSMNGLNEMGEHMMNSVLTEAVIRSIKVMNDKRQFIDKNGNVVEESKAASLFDMLSLNENGKLVMSDKVVYTKKNLDSKYHEGGKQHINYVIKKKGHDLYGVYDPLMKAEIAKTWWGKTVLMFKNFFLSSLKYRYKGVQTSLKSKDELTEDDISFNNAEQEFTEGIYTTFIRFIKEGVIPTLKGLQLAHSKDYYNSLTEYEKSNLKKTTLEIGLTMVLLPVLGALLGAAAGDDDDKIYFAMYVFRRLESELSQFRDPRELNRMIQNPVAANRFIQNSFNAIFNIATPLNFAPQNNEQFFDYLSEDAQGKNITLKHIKKITPFYAQFDKDYNKLYNLINK